MKGAYNEQVAEYALALAFELFWAHCRSARGTVWGEQKGRVRRFGTGEPLLGLVDLDAGY